ncbi:MAG: N-acetylmuramoyl-L-alanine amidase [Caulobacteraceae bacterium]
MTGALGGNWTRIAAAAIFAGVMAAIFWVSGGSAAGINLVRVRFGGDLTETRVVLDLDRSVSGRVTADGAADNMIVVSLPNIEATSDLNGRGQGLVRAWAIDQAGGAARLRLELSGAATIKRRFLLPPADGVSNYRYVIDIAAATPVSTNSNRAPASRPTALASAPQAAAAAGARAGVTATPVGQIITAPALRIRKIIVIDAGHGGRDPGALGASSQEKDVNLAAARALKARLERTGRYQVVMTRDTDVFIPLETRVQIARRANADLFISLHADSGPDATRRGASVYTLSEQAGPRVSRVLNRNEWFMGGPAATDGAVGQILLDLTQRSTRNRSATFAQILLDQLADRTTLLPRSRRDAGYFVLLAPDVPAVLLEMGFITSPDDERDLNDTGRRKRVMDAVGDAIDRYFSEETEIASN